MYKPYKSYRGWKRKPRRRPWYFYLALIIGIPIALELLLRLIVGITGLDQAFTQQTSDEAKRVEAYQMSFLSPQGQPYEQLAQGTLKAARSPLMGYQLLPEQKSSYWTINAQGFRDDDPVPAAKAPNEVRIFVLGGSMAFGEMSSSNQATFTHQLETLLNNRVKEQQAKSNQFQPAILPYTADEVTKVLQRPARIPERQYRVVNAAVPGYASGNDLAMLVQQVTAYSPDMIILLNSSEDLLLPSTYSGADVPGIDALLSGQDAVSPKTNQTLQNWFGQLYLVQAVRHYFLPRSQPTIALRPATQDLAQNETELTARIDRYKNHLLQIVRWSSATRKRLVIGIQPDLAVKPDKQQSPAEKAMVSELGGNYSQQMESGYSQLVTAAQQVAQTSANAQLLDLRQLGADSQEPTFQSPNGLTDQAYKAMAGQFYEALVKQLAIDPKPYGAG